MSGIYTVNFIIYTGTDVEQTFVLVNDADERPLNLYGYTLSSSMKKHDRSSVYVNLNPVIANEPLGKISLILTAEQSSNLIPGRYYYDIVISKDDVRTRVVEGEIFVRRSVTR